MEQSRRARNRREGARRAAGSRRLPPDPGLRIPEPEPDPYPFLTEPEADALAARLMRRQLRLSVGVAVVFLAMALGLPAVNYWLPEVAARRVLGFSATWLFLGVLFYPITWLLAGYFVRASEALDRRNAAVAEEALGSRGPKAPKTGGPASAEPEGVSTP